MKRLEPGTGSVAYNKSIAVLDGSLQKEIDEFSELVKNHVLSRQETSKVANDLMKKAETRIATLKSEIQRSNEKISVMEALKPWCDLKEYRLERNDYSRLHKLADAMTSDSVFSRDELASDRRLEAPILCHNAHVFVVDHDWAGAFGDAIDGFDAEYCLPYQHCAFEFRISGKTIVSIAMQPEGEKAGFVAFLDAGNGFWWAMGSQDDDEIVLSMIWNQIKAICVALDAEVATHEVVRAPTALNKKIERLNRCPVFDYHVVHLAKRYRAAPAESSQSSGRHHRLHFRRGHWRHYESHKTWIKWMLVGDPALGFIDKHYSL